MRRDIPVIFLGLGNVGQALLRQILDTRDVLARRAGLRLVPVALADTSGVLLDPTGLSDEALRAVLQTKASNRPLNTLVGQQNGILSYLDDVLRPGAILMDVTASTETEPMLQAALNAGCRVVLSNKHPLSVPWEKARQFLEHPHLRYEATVGAGLPVVATLRYLLDTGDRIAAIEGCLSGTMGYLCAELERGVSYSAAVYQARSLGYTEPDPREDLSGRDMARKSLILARTAGWPLEIADLTVEALYPASLADIPAEAFMAATSTLDEEYAARVVEARADGMVLRYVARVGPDGGEVGLAAVPQDGPLGALRGPANYIAFYTDRYSETGLVVSGPGAGPKVTAAGVLGDILEATSLEPSSHIPNISIPTISIPTISIGKARKPTLTMKFGGTSVGSAEAFAQVADIVLEQAEQWDRLVVVVSAMSGVTDALTESARSAASGDAQTSIAIVADLRARHHRAVDELLSEPVARSETSHNGDEGGERAKLRATVDAYMDELSDFCRSVRVLG
ncbi:MAG: hypothetical protein U9R15_20885, partial [Chloroflexota bacterium]|nr:hypothetical protein [Chloroflexota bacterium]